MKKKNTSLSRERILEVLHTGKKTRKESLIFFTLPHSPTELDLGGFAVVVPKTIAPLSTLRNRLKRIAREYLRKMAVSQQIDIVLLIRSSNERALKNILQTLEVL